MVLAGAAIVAVGSLLPWATITTAFGTLQRNGTDGDGDGLITLLLAGAIVFVTLIGQRTRLSAIVVLVLAAIAFMVVAYDMSNLRENLGEVESRFATASVGVGMYVCGAGALLAGAGSILWFHE